MKLQIVPFAQRSASKALRTIARGSRVSLPDAETIRLFLWWKDGDHRTDIDLSALGLNENFGIVTQIAYYNLRELGCHHSGDITGAPKGAAEFIDVTVPTLLKAGVQYVVMCLNSFTQQPYCDLPECFAGWMARSKPNSGEIFDPRTVQDKIDLAANTTVAVPIIFDLVEKQAIWTDLALTSRVVFNNVANCHNNVHTQRGNLSDIAEVMANLNKPNLYDLALMHAEARGKIVSSKEEADTIFSLHEGITPYDIDKILSELLA